MFGERHKQQIYSCINLNAENIIIVPLRKMFFMDTSLGIHSHCIPWNRCGDTCIVDLDQAFSVLWTLDSFNYCHKNEVLKVNIKIIKWQNTKCYSDDYHQNHASL